MQSRCNCFVGSACDQDAAARSGVRKQLPAGSRRGRSASTHRRPDRRATRDGSCGLLALARISTAAPLTPAHCVDGGSAPANRAGPLHEAAL